MNEERKLLAARKLLAEVDKSGKVDLGEDLMLWTRHSIIKGYVAHGHALADAVAWFGNHDYWLCELCGFSGIDSEKDLIIEFDFYQIDLEKWSKK